MICFQEAENSLFLRNKRSNPFLVVLAVFVVIVAVAVVVVVVVALMTMMMH